MDLVYGKEKTLFVISLVISLIVWLALVAGTFGVALLWVLMFFIIYLFAQSAFISYLKGTAVRITSQQFPDLYQRVVTCCAKLGMKEIPETYLLHGNGVFNALATRFLGRNFIVLFSDVVDALADRPEAVNFYIGHELGHIQRRHLVWAPLLFPASVFPLLGAAYSRAREYTCDRFGLACCAVPDDAQAGLAALAAGGRRWKTLSHENYIGQRKGSSGFWMSFHEVISDYPWLVKRMATVNALGAKQTPRHPRRHALAWLLALFVPRLGVGGGAGVIVTIAIIGVLAAIAIPAYQDYTQRAHMAAVSPLADQAKRAVVEYAVKNQAWPMGNADIGLPEGGYGQAIKSIRVEGRGVIVIAIASGKGEAGRLVYSPYVKEQRILWECTGQGIAPKYLPADCR